jgi:glutathione S-transferase
MVFPIYPALVTGLALLLYLMLIINVSRARGLYKIEAPATSGDPGFERVFRVQQNTLEQIVAFLPALWLFSVYVSPQWGAGIGFLWVLARTHYAWSYYRDAAKRGPGYAVGLFCTVALVIGGIAGMLRAF